MSGQKSKENKINKDKLMELLSVYNNRALSKKSGLSYNTIARLSTPTKQVNDITGIVALKLAHAMNMDVEKFIKIVYDIE